MRVFLLCLGCLLATVAAEDYEELFQADTAALLKAESNWKALFNCLMGRGPCGEYEGVKDSTPAEDFEIFFQTDPKPLLEDEAKWKLLFECLMDMRPCDQYLNIKDTLPKLVQNKCKGCTPEQKEKFNKILQQFLEKYPEDYTELSNKFFPKNENSEMP